MNKIVGIIPCAECGCQTMEGVNEDGQNLRIDICGCHDGSGEFEVTITPLSFGDICHEKHQCKPAELESCLESRYKIDYSTLKHKCH